MRVAERPWPSKCGLRGKTKSVFLVGSGTWTASNVGLGAGDSGNSTWSWGLRLIVLKGTAGDAVYYLPFGVVGSQPPSLGYWVLRGVLNNVTHLEVFLLSQAPVGIFLWSVFGKLEDIFGNLWLPQAASFWKPPLEGMQWTLYKQTPLRQGRWIHHFVGRWYNRGSSSAQLIRCSIRFFVVNRHEGPWRLFLELGHKLGVTVRPHLMPWMDHEGHLG